MAFVRSPQRLSLSSSYRSGASVWFGGASTEFAKHGKAFLRISKSQSTLANSCQWKKSSVLPWDLLCDTDDWKLAHVFLLFENTYTGVRNFQPTNPPPPLFCCFRETECNYSVAPIFGAARLIGLLQERARERVQKPDTFWIVIAAKPSGHRKVRVVVVVGGGGLHWGYDLKPKSQLFFRTRPSWIFTFSLHLLL